MPNQKVGLCGLVDPAIAVGSSGVVLEFAGRRAYIRSDGRTLLLHEQISHPAAFRLLKSEAAFL